MKLIQIIFSLSTDEFSVCVFIHIFAENCFVVKSNFLLLKKESLDWGVPCQIEEISAFMAFAVFERVFFHLCIFCG